MISLKNQLVAATSITLLMSNLFAVARANPLVLWGGEDIFAPPVKPVASIPQSTYLPAHRRPVSAPPLAPGYHSTPYQTGHFAPVNNTAPTGGGTLGNQPAGAYQPNYYEPGHGGGPYPERPSATVPPEHQTYFQKHPKVKSAVMGATVGTAAGAITGLVTHRGILRGATIGAGAGAGVGLMHSSSTLASHPIVRDIATGALTGLGLGWAGSRRDGSAVKGALVGGAVGLGLGVLKHGAGQSDSTN